MGDRALGVLELEQARATLAALRSSAEVRNARHAPPSAPAIRRRRIAGAGKLALGFACAAASVFAFAAGGSRHALDGLIASAGAIFFAASGVGDFVLASHVVHAVARLVVVLRRDVDPREKWNDGSRFRVVVQEADGTTHELRGVAEAAWNRLIPGHAALVWHHETEFGDFRDLGPAIADASEVARRESSSA